VTALADLAAATDPALREYAVADPGGARYDGAAVEPARAFVLEADALYALGLARLAEQGDLSAVAELADLISACAQAHADNRAEQAETHWTASAQKLARAG
jgi:hypothetical protein